MQLEWMQMLQDPTTGGEEVSTSDEMSRVGGKEQPPPEAAVSAR